MGFINQGWLNVLVYWLMGWLVGLKMGYVSTMWRELQQPPLSWDRVVALILTVAIKLRLNARYTSFGRQRPDIFTIVLFAIGNGTAETFLFFAFYDWGRFLFCSGSSSSMNFACMFFGFFVYYIYSFLIHQFFWLPHVFPPHIKPGMPSFVKFGLLYVTCESLLWFSLYQWHGDVLWVVGLHTLVDAMAAINIAIPAPWEVVSATQPSNKES